MIEGFVAFRAFGTFAWPPFPYSGAGEIVDEKDGVVEIHYLALGPSVPLVACLRWVPRADLLAAADHWVPLPSQVTPIPLFQTDEAGIRNALGDGSQETIFLLASREAANLVGARLSFDGIRALEQFAPWALSSVAPKFKGLSLRLPIVRSQRGPGDYMRSRLSALVVGRDNKTDYRFDLALSLPQAAMLAENDSPLSICGWSSVYHSSYDETDNGAIGVKAQKIFFGVRGNQCGLASQPRDKTLGRFEFVLAKPSSGPPWAQTHANHWSIAKQAPAVLARMFGLTGPASQSAFKEVAVAPPNLPVFPSIVIAAGDGGTFRIIQRTAFATPGVVSNLLAFLVGSTLDRDGPDLRIKNAEFQLRIEPGRDRWLKLGKTLYGAIVAEGRLDSHDVWRTAATPVDLQLTLAASIRVTTSGLSSASIDLAKGANPAELLGAALAMARPVYDQLASIEPQQPQSTIPTMTLSDKESDTLFALVADVAGRLDWDGGILRSDASRPHYAASLLAPMRLGRADILPPSIGFRARWTAFHRPRQPDITVRLRPRAPQAGDVGYFLSFAVVQETDIKVTAGGTLGGLDFRRANGPLLAESDFEASALRIGIADAKRNESGHRLRLAANFRFALDAATPVAIDIMRGDRRFLARPLLFDEAVELDGRYVLLTDETVGGERDRRLTAQLIDQVEMGRTRGSSVTLGTEPFVFRRNWSLPLGARGDQSTAIAAIYDSDTRLWQYRQSGDPYHYVQQAQLRAESMDKSGRLELHDAVPVDGVEILPPLPDAHARGLRRHAVEFRLSPPADIWVTPSEDERAYYPPEVSSDQIFSDRETRGVALLALRAEFAYGLPTALLPPLEEGPSRSARAAEIEALLGSFPGEARLVGPASSMRWGDVRRAIASRPERIEIIARVADSEIAYPPAAFKRARFAVRTTALHRPPLAVDEASAIIEAAPLLSHPKGPRFHALGLSGGPFWPFESHNILEMLLADPEPIGGIVDNVALSPVGADADQTVSFANGRVKIITETRMGLIQRQRVEVLGRVGALWHRCKHVIVYERSVAPSAQFTPIAEPGDNDAAAIATRSRRAVLRKFSECVEFMQPERRYPDFAGVAVSTSSFLNAVRFNSRIIPVDSAWGRDVGDIGWEVPLWNRHAARQRPQVYGRPDVSFLTACEGHGALEEAGQECDNPENLYFFADTTRETGEDTDVWKERALVDYSPLGPPDPKTALAATPPDLSGSAKSFQGEAAAVPLGLGRFTWRLGPPSQRTRINAGRGEKPVYAALRTITFMRAGKPVEDPDAGTPALAALNIARNIKAQRAEPLLSTWRHGESLAHGPETLVALSQELKATAAMFASGPGAPSAKERLVALRNRLIAVPNDQSLEQAIDAFKKPFVDALPLGNAAQALLTDEGTKYCEQLGANLEATFLARKNALSRELGAVKAELDQGLATVDPTYFPPWLADRDALRAYVRQLIAEAVEPSFKMTTAAFGTVRHAIESARDNLKQCRGELLAGVDRTGRDLGALKQTVDQAKPWSEARLAELQGKIDDLFKKAARTLGQAISDARARLSAEIDATSQTVGEAAGQGLAALTVGQADIIGYLDQARSHILQLTTALGVTLAQQYGPNSPLEKARTRLLQWADQHDAHEAQARAAAAQLTRLAELLQDAHGKLAALPTTADVLAERIDRESQVAVAELAAAIGAGKTEADQQLANLDADLADAEKTLRQYIGDLLADIHTPMSKAMDNLFTTVAGADLVQGAECWTNLMIDAFAREVEAVRPSIEHGIAMAFEGIDCAANELQAKVAAVEKRLQPAALSKEVVEALIDAADVDDAIDRLPEDIFAENASQHIDAFRTELDQLFKTFRKLIEAEGVGKLFGDLKQEICETLDTVVQKASDLRNELVKQGQAVLDEWRNAAQDWIGLSDQDIDEIIADAERFQELYDSFKTLDDDVRKVGETLSKTREAAEAYADRITSAVSNSFADGVLAAPGNILRAMAAAASVPELPNLDFVRNRLNYYYGALQDVVDTTEIEAYFGKLGDSLKALGLSLPFDKIGDNLLPVDLSKFDIGRIFNNFGGLQLDKLFKGVKLPKGLEDNIKVSHDFDKSSFRAWVQIDVKVKIEKRSTLFAIGPFQLEVVQAELTGFLKLEASKDKGEIETKGRTTFKADFDCVVAGQTMVTLRDVSITYSEGGGMDVDFDPSKIKLNPSLEFIQKSLATIFPDEVGGVALIKRDGIPIGIEHVFDMPPISLMGVTSGVQNIAIANRFRLVAYPDFVLSNRFELSRPERPFIFSIFILGGTGWVSVDVEYRPFKDELTVIVDAAVGGSASIGFAFVGVTGTMFITLSGVLTYRKLISGSGGGLGISLVLLIAGIVDVLGIASGYLGQTLRICYKDDGGMDARGDFTIEIRITRFFKVQAGGEANYPIKSGGDSAGNGNRSEVRSVAASDLSVDRETHEIAQGLAEARRAG